MKRANARFDAAVTYLPYLDAEFRNASVTLEVRTVLINL